MCEHPRWVNVGHLGPQQPSRGRWLPVAFKTTLCSDPGSEIHHCVRKEVENMLIAKQSVHLWTGGTPQYDHSMQFMEPIRVHELQSGLIRNKGDLESTGCSLSLLQWGSRVNNLCVCVLSCVYVWECMCVCVWVCNGYQANSTLECRHRKANTD